MYDYRKVLLRILYAFSKCTKFIRSVKKGDFSSKIDFDFPLSRREKSKYFPFSSANQTLGRPIWLRPFLSELSRVLTFLDPLFFSLTALKPRETSHHKKEMDQNTSFELEISPDDELGTIVVIQKDGVDGGQFPLIKGQNQWWIGRSPDSDIQLKVFFFGFADSHSHF